MALCRLPLAAAIVAAGFVGANPLSAQAPHDEADGLFGPTHVWSIHLELTPAEYDAMQPPAPGFPGAPSAGGPPAPPAAPRAGDARDSERNLFGTEFRWAQANFAAEGQKLEKVGIRYAGDITYLVSAGGLKRPLAIQFDKFHDQKFQGLAALQLHAMPLDPAKSREALASSIFRACGVPAPRTTFAEVTLTVPGRFDKQSLGLYTIVEAIDEPYFARHFGSPTGLAMRPFGIRGIDFVGESWDRYQGTYRPQRKATPDEEARVIALARLINSAPDDEFAREIGEYIDVDAFLRYMAANALSANLEGFLALGHNYTLYLDSRTNKFHFLPGDLEFSLANLLLFGSPDELMNLSLTKPYPGENKLPDRLLAIPEHAKRYRALLEQLSTTVFIPERLTEDAAAIDKATREIREKEQAAVAAAPAPPAGGFGPPGAFGPQAPDIKTFIERRTKSIADQLTGTSTGYVPRPFSFGPPPGAGAGGGGGGFGRGREAEPITAEKFRESVKTPPAFEATLFAAPPQVSYPVAIACEGSGAVYVAVDEQGSLGRTPGGGRILRCVDTDDDGRVDKVTVFAKVEHPRGVTYRDGRVWVMHPPTLAVFQDDDGDGVADREETLVTGLTTNQLNDRGGDHTTNCVRMGIDGWLYIGVGDYGIKQAKAKDGSTVVLRGGGIVRVRPDGTELEVYCTGLRNPFDIAIDPYLNLFTRDNTNDGAGWDTRVSLLKQSAQYGYTQLFANFTDETMPTLGTFGNSGGTGGLYIEDPRWPAEFRSTLLTGDWGRSEVYRHELAPSGPTFDLQQEVFLQVPRATGMDIDGRGRLYVASWYGGEASVFVGPNVGFVARIAPRELSPEPFPDLKRAKLSELSTHLASPLSVVRHHTQGEFLARGRSAEATEQLAGLARNAKAPLATRFAALFTLKQLDGRASHEALLKLAETPELREFALRALTDRRSELDGLTADPFVAALADPSPRVRAQALISLGRLGDRSAAAKILPLTAREAGSSLPTTRPVQNQPDPGRVVPHLAVRALVALEAVEPCLAVLDAPEADQGQIAGALQTLRYLHRPAAVEGLIKRLRTARDAELRQGILSALARLCYREADYDGSWWGIRPDNTGPYYDPVEWEETKRIRDVLAIAYTDGDKATRDFLRTQLARHQVSLPGLADLIRPAEFADEQPLTLPKADPADPNQIGNLAFDEIVRRALAAKGDAARGAALLKSQSCTACHTTDDGQTPRGPHLFEIGKRYMAAELVESILKPSAKLAQGYETALFRLTDGRVVQGFVVSERASSTIIREANGVRHEIAKSDIEERRRSELSSMPEGLVANLSPEQLADLIAYLQSLR
jgi:putative membrane-bound dehydrogenase-like protein